MQELEGRFSREEVAWALSQVHSRSFVQQGHHVWVPGIDLCNHTLSANADIRRAGTGMHARQVGGQGFDAWKVALAARQAGNITHAVAAASWSPSITAPWHLALRPAGVCTAPAAARGQMRWTTSALQTRQRRHGRSPAALSWWRGTQASLPERKSPSATAAGPRMSSCCSLGLRLTTIPTIRVSGCGGSRAAEDGWRLVVD
jgi:hypothetical protein